MTTPRKLTINVTLQIVRSTGMTCTYDSAVAEYRIDYPLTDPRRSSSSSYFTPDAEDAINTACTMAEFRPEGAEV